MSKALIVLAECVDIRNGKRFQPGEEFKPAPNPEQARRLVRGACLPEAAIDAAVAAETEAEKAAEADAVKARKADEATAKALADAKHKAAARLAAAKAKGKGNLDPALAQSTQVGDELLDLSDEEFAKVVAEELDPADVPPDADKATLVAAIRSARAAKA